MNAHERPFALAPTACVVVELAGDPAGKGRPRFGNGRVYTPEKTHAYETQLQWQARMAMRNRAPMDGPVRVEILAAFSIPGSWNQQKKRDAMNGLIRPTGKPDADNILKSAGDALNRIVWKDDSQIVIASISKRYSDKPRLYILVEVV